MAETGFRLSLSQEAWVLKGDGLLFLPSLAWTISRTCTFVSVSPPVFALQTIPHLAARIIIFKPMSDHEPCLPPLSGSPVSQYKFQIPFCGHQDIAWLSHLPIFLTSSLTLQRSSSSTLITLPGVILFFYFRCDFLTECFLILLHTPDWGKCPFSVSL